MEERQVMEWTLVIFMEGEGDFSWNHTEAYQHKIKKQALFPLTDGLSWHSYIIPCLPAAACPLFLFTSLCLVFLRSFFFAWLCLLRLLLSWIIQQRQQRQHERDRNKGMDGLSGLFKRNELPLPLPCSPPPPNQLQKKKKMQSVCANLTLVDFIDWGGTWRRETSS